MVINKRFIAQWGGASWSNKDIVYVNLPTSFTAWYTAISTDVGGARICYATTANSVSQIRIYTINAANLGCRWLAIGF